MLRAHIIYIRTSLFPGQRLTLTMTEEMRVQKAASEIITLTKPRWGSSRPIASVNMVCLFLVGTVVQQDAQKQHILDVLDEMNDGATGWNFQRAAKALRVLYDEQRNYNDTRELDWWAILKQRGLLDFSFYGI